MSHSWFAESQEWHEGLPRWQAVSSFGRAHASTRPMN